MLGSYRSELMRLGKRPTTWVLLAAWMALYHLFAYALPYASYLTGEPNDQTTGLAQREVLGSTLPDQLVVNALGGLPIFAGAIALIFGSLVVGSEYGWGTIQTLLTQGPSRLRVLAAKVLAISTAALGGVLVTFVTGAGVAAFIAWREDAAAHWPSPADVAQGIGAGWLIMTMWCLVGAALALVFRGVALAAGLGVVWILGVENLVSNAAETLLTSLQPVRDVLPGANSGSLVAALTAGIQVGEPSPGVTAAVSGTRALLTLAGYVLVSAILAGWVLRRRDTS